MGHEWPFSWTQRTNYCSLTSALPLRGNSFPLATQDILSSSCLLHGISDFCKDSRFMLLESGIRNRIQELVLDSRLSQDSQQTDPRNTHVKLTTWTQISNTHICILHLSFCASELWVYTDPADSDPATWGSLYPFPYELSVMQAPHLQCACSCKSTCPRSTVGDLWVRSQPSVGALTEPWP
jgi:hypothetical protein